MQRAYRKIGEQPPGCSRKVEFYGAPVCFVEQEGGEGVSRNRQPGFFLFAEQWAELANLVQRSWQAQQLRFT